MLTNTFCHLPGVGEKTERGLWSSGVTSWDCALRASGTGPAPGGGPNWVRHLQESLCHYEERNPRYFAEHLPPGQLWRLYRDFQDRCAFLDIETTGLGPGADVTTVALYDGRKAYCFVRGVNLDDFPAVVREYSVLVTYNGKSFDLPFLERRFGARLPHAHLDLRHTLRSLGLVGGLKGCERQLGLDRGELADVDGFMAVLLWNEYRRCDDGRALETLLAYNLRDAVTLQGLMTYAYNEKVKATPFAERLVLPPAPPAESPFRADRETVERLRRRYAAYLNPRAT